MKIQSIIKGKMVMNKKFLGLKLSDVAFILLINVKMPTTVGILTFMGRINFMLGWVEHEKRFITLRPDLCLKLLIINETLSTYCSFYTLPHFSVGVLCYTFRCLSVRPCSPFPIDNLSIYSRNFFKFCIHIVIGDEWYGIVNGQNPSIFSGVTALFRIGKMVSGLLFLYCS